MSGSSFEEKFIAFVDVLGFTDMIEKAEAGKGRPLSEIQEILSELERSKDKAFYAEYGPQVCPSSFRIRKDLSFEITQVSDCAVVSAEVSPAGAINIVQHCWAVAMKLLTMGVMTRGYVTKGKIIHKDNRFMGTGYHTAYKREAGVSAFKIEADEKGTPFIEIDSSVTTYIDTCEDKCVKEMFNRMVKKDRDLTAVFPFQSLSHSFIIGDFMGRQFDPEREKESNNNLRSSIQGLKERLMHHVDQGNEAAVRKTRHYIAALDAQLSVCDRMDQSIDALMAPFPRQRT